MARRVNLKNLKKEMEAKNKPNRYARRDAAIKVLRTNGITASTKTEFIW